MADLKEQYKALFAGPGGEDVLADICRRGNLFEACYTDEDRIRENFAKEILNLAKPHCFRLQNNAGQIGSPNFGSRIFGPRQIIVFTVHPNADAGTNSPATSCSLVGGRL